MTHALAPTKLPRDLGDGLILRRSTVADADRLAEFNGIIHKDPASAEPERAVAAWVRDLLLKPHPTFDPGDFTVVEDTTTGKIVSSCNLISQTWTYAACEQGGVAFGVGRPELVGTDPAYRKRGLVRAQFDLLHEWSAARGELVQVITGIPFYYRQFGYEMAVNLGGGRLCHPSSLPKRKEGATGADAEPFRIRRATDADVGVFLDCDRLLARRSLISVARDEAMWRYEISGRSAGSGAGARCYVIETAEGAPAGALLVGEETQGTRGWIPFLELLPGVSYLAAAPSILRACWTELTAMMTARGKTLESLQYGLGADHPFYRVNWGRLAHIRKPYAWYVRVPDLKAFLRLITPVLDARVARSAAAHHTGDLLLSFYRCGIRIHFERGAIAEITDWQPNDDDAHASFPGLSFIQMLFGYRTVDELSAAFPDFVVNDDDGRPLLEAMFPAQMSRLWPVA